MAGKQDCLFRGKETWTLALSSILKSTFWVPNLWIFSSFISLTEAILVVIDRDKAIGAYCCEEYNLSCGIHLLIVVDCEARLAVEVEERNSFVQTWYIFVEI